jgi:hypothetical protein
MKDFIARLRAQDRGYDMIVVVWAATKCQKSWGNLQYSRGIASAMGYNLLIERWFNKTEPGFLAAETLE